MPTYDIICPHCGLYENDLHKTMDEPFPLCPVCNRRMQQNFKTMSAAVQTFNKYAGLWEDLADEPIEIRCRSQLKEECKKRGKYSTLLHG